MNLAPIILFTYNRLKHTRATVSALQQNRLAEASNLIVFSDGAFDDSQYIKVGEVRDFLKGISGFKNIEIIERERNYGLAENIIDGVTRVIEEYRRCIVLEDDLITSPFFLKYMNEALDLYEDNSKVISVHGYVYPVRNKLPETFFLRGADCLGWATWKRGWDKFEKNGSILLNKILENKLGDSFDYNNSYPYTQMLKDQTEGKNTSWAVRWYASAFINDLYTLYPGRSLIFHAGGDGSGVNTGYDKLLDVKLSKTPVQVTPLKVKPDSSAFKAYIRFHQKLTNPPLLYRIKRAIKKLNSPPNY